MINKIKKENYEKAWINKAILENDDILKYDIAIDVFSTEKYIESFNYYNEKFTYLGIGKIYSHTNNLHNDVLQNDDTMCHFWKK